MDPKDLHAKGAPQTVDDEEIIDLTEILGEEASETVIEISAKMDELDSLDLKTLLAEEAAAAPGPAAGPKEENAESLEDLLSSLNFAPGEPAAAPAPEPEPEPAPAPEPLPEPAPPPESAVPPVAAAASLEEVRQQVQVSVSEDQIREIVREVVQETAARLCRELFPGIASEAVAREIAALKKSLEEEI